MTDTRRVVALLVAAGTGSRAGGDIPKQFQILAGRPMLAHAYRALANHPGVDEVVAVIGAGQEAMLDHALGPVPRVTGGATRRESVARGLAAIGAATHVLVHDAARPFLPQSVIDRLLTVLEGHDAVTPAMAVADTLAGVTGAALGDVVPRGGVVRIQTPQAFSGATLARAHAEWPPAEEATDDAQMVRRLGVEVAVVQGDPMLDKVTHPADFAAAEARALVSRTATGFDVHRLEDGETLWLGGVLIPFHRGLSGHSDADVALHAITDALLGTIAAGDIGTHFPPSDPQWKGADSAQFLQHAATLVANKGGVIDFIDLTLMCEAPKIGPHRAAMTTRIADLLGLSEEQVSVKATTTERLGFTGRGEGIAAQAAATVRLPRSLR